MKKLAIASIMALAAVSASAAEFGVFTNAHYAGDGDKHTGTGLSIGQHYGAYSVTGAFERVREDAQRQDRYSVTAGYDVATLGPVTITPKLGVAYLHHSDSAAANGYAMTVGVGASMPLTKQFALTVDAKRQYGQDRVADDNGNSVAVGLKYKF